MTGLFPKIAEIDPGKIIDNVHTSDQERNDTITERLRIDSATDFWVPQAIRPFLSITMTGLYVYMILYGLHHDLIEYSTSLLATAGIVSTIIAFYFSGRTKIKIANIQAASAVKITELQTKHQIKEERRDNKQTRKKNKKVMKNSRKPDPKPKPKPPTIPPPGN